VSDHATARAPCLGIEPGRAPGRPGHRARGTRSGWDLARAGFRPGLVRLSRLGQPSGGALTFAGPAVARNADGRLEAAAVGMDLAVWHAWQRQPGSDWTRWHPLGHPGGKEVVSGHVGPRPPGPTPALVGDADGCLVLFATELDSSNGLWHARRPPRAAAGRRGNRGHVCCRSTFRPVGRSRSRRWQWMRTGCCNCSCESQALGSCTSSSSWERTSPLRPHGPGLG
jgi:hypothetical protein